MSLPPGSTERVRACVRLRAARSMWPKMCSALLPTEMGIDLWIGQRGRRRPARGYDRTYLSREHEW